MILSETESKFYTLQHTDCQILVFFTNLSPRFPTFIFSVSNRITNQKSEVFDCQRLPIFFIAFLASFWRDKRRLNSRNCAFYLKKMLIEYDLLSKKRYSPSYRYDSIFVDLNMVSIYYS